MLRSLTDSEQIRSLKQQRRVLILAHHYQDPEIQELADVVGDSLELAQAARRVSVGALVCCGVRSMAETVKVLNPDRAVAVPDGGAGCSLVDSCPVEGLRAFKRRNPSHAIVSYIRTSVEVQAESDIMCTSRNAVAVVNSLPPQQPILFLPDVNLGNYVQKQTGRKNMKIWQGACIVHATFPARRLAAARAQHPEALVAAHPECPGEVLRSADFVGSPSEIVEWCALENAQEFIVMTESGVRFSLEQRAPGKRFYFVHNENCNCSECPYMRQNSLEKLRACLETLEPRIEPPAGIMDRARVGLERMLAVG
jgi:quinolinate synthase